MTTLEKTKITVGATIHASVERVWNAWNNPSDITKWNSPSPDWHCPTAQNDLQVGGKLKSRMEAKDGSFGFDFEGTYNEVVPFKKIAYTIADGRAVVSTFEKQDGKTKLTTVFEAEGENPLEMQQGGWQAIVDSFKNYIESTNN